MDYELVLNLTWVASKDGRVIAQRVRDVLAQHGIDGDDVVWAITDGGGDNHGGDTTTGYGAHGTVSEAVGQAVWVWCQVQGLGLGDWVLGMGACLQPGLQVSVLLHSLASLSNKHN